MLPLEQTVPANPFPPLEDGSAQLAAFIQGQPPFIRRNLGEICEQSQHSHKHHVVKSDGEVLTFFGKQIRVRIRHPGIAPGFYLLQEKTVRRADCYPRMGIPDVETVKPNLHKMWAEGRLRLLTNEQAGEVVKFIQFGRDNHNMSSFVVTPTSIYAATATSFAIPIETGLNIRIAGEALITTMVELMRYPQFLIGTALTVESGYSIHEETVLFGGLDWGSCVIAACDASML